MKRIFTIVALLGTLVFSGVTHASITINVTEVGGNVVFSTSGSLDLTGATSVLMSVSYADGVIPGGNNCYSASGAGNTADTFALTSVDLPFGTSTTLFSPPSSSTGDDFLIWGAGGGTPQVGVSSGYISGSAINSGMVFNGATFASLTLIAGTYNFAIPNDTIVLNIGGGGAIPEPGTLMIWSVFAATGLVMSKRRRNV